MRKPDFAFTWFIVWIYGLLAKRSPAFAFPSARSSTSTSPHLHLRATAQWPDATLPYRSILRLKVPTPHVESLKPR